MKEKKKRKFHSMHFNFCRDNLIGFWLYAKERTGPARLHHIYVERVKFKIFFGPESYGVKWGRFFRMEPEF